jgi:hypothetical protein
MHGNSTYQIETTYYPLVIALLPMVVRERYLQSPSIHAVPVHVLKKSLFSSADVYHSPWTLGLQ